MTRARILLGAYGDPGHAFPMIALGGELARRGHEVTLQTWHKWRAHVEAEGIAFARAHTQEDLSPDRPDRLLKPYQAAVRGARLTLPLVEELGPDCVMSDIITLSPGLAGEMAGVPVGTVVPHVDPRPGPGFPIYSIGARPPRTAAGRALWTRAHARLVTKGLERGRVELNGARERLGLPPVDRWHGGLSERLTIIGTIPHLEYPRPGVAPGTHVVGPLLWEPPGEQRVEPPRGDGPVVLVAPSTAQDPEHRMLRAALDGLADTGCRVIATWNRRPPDPPLDVPPNAVVVDWLSYARTMPACDVVVSHAGHGTLMRALSNGCAVVCCPVTGDMPENAARIDWAGLGVRLPRRFVTPRGVRLAVERALGSARVRAGVAGAAAWCRAHDGTARAADLVLGLAAEGRRERAPRRAA